MPSKSQKIPKTKLISRARRVFAGILVFALLVLDSPVAVFAAENRIAASNLSSKILTDELEILSESKPELIENRDDAREEKILEMKDKSEKWTERIVLEKIKNGEVEDVLGKRKSSEKVVAELKAAGVVSTLADEASGKETEINPNLVKSSGDKLRTESTPYSAEISKNSADPLVLAENSESSGDILSAETNDSQIAEDTTPETREEVRYFNWNANEVAGENEDNKIIYPDLWQSTDLLVTTSELGMKEDLILKNSRAPTEFEYLVETVGLELEITEDGGFQFLDADGNEKFYTPPPNLTDATGQFVEDGLRYSLGWTVEPEVPAVAVAEIEKEISATPVSEIRFDENSGDEFADSISEKSGSIGGGEWVAGALGSALQFTAESDGAEIARDFEIGNEMTFSAWVRADEYQNSRIASVGRHSLQQDIKRGWKAVFEIGDKRMSAVWKDQTLYIGEWYHLVATFDGKKIRIFVNGVEENYQNVEGDLISNDEPIVLGENFAGSIDEFKIWNRALSVDEIFELTQKDLEREIEIPAEEIPVEEVVEPEIEIETPADEIPEVEIEVVEFDETGIEIEVIEESINKSRRRNSRGRKFGNCGVGSCGRRNSRGRKCRRRNCRAGSCGRRNSRGRKCRAGNSRGGNCPGRKCGTGNSRGGNCPGRKCRVGSSRGGNCPGRKCRAGNSRGGNCRTGGRGARAANFVFAKTEKFLFADGGRARK